MNSNLERALANHSYVMRHVAGGQANHAAAIMSRLEVAGAAPNGADIDALIAAHERQQRAEEAEQARRRAREDLRVERQRLVLWEQHIAALERGHSLSLPDGTPLTLDVAVREHAVTANAIEWLRREAS